MDWCKGTIVGNHGFYHEVSRVSFFFHWLWEIRWVSTIDPAGNETLRGSTNQSGHPKMEGKDVKHEAQPTITRVSACFNTGFWINEFSQGNLGNLIWSNAAMVANGRVSRWRGVLQLLGSTRDATSYHEAASSCELGSWVLTLKSCCGNYWDHEFGHLAASESRIFCLGGQANCHVVWV